MEEIKNMQTSFAEQKKLIERAVTQANELQKTLDKLNDYPMLLHSDDGKFVITFEQDDFI